jgi:NAD-dependent deacetylase
MSGQELDILAGRIADLIIESRKLVVFTGAGISTESGIPDFRSPGGIWERFDPEDFTYDRFLTDIECRKKQWRMLKEGILTDKAEPNPAHVAVAELDRMGKLDCVVTQNIDNLHQKAGVPDEKVYELHGNMQWAICLNCGSRYTFVEIKTRIDRGEEMPDCENCGGMLKPDVVMFGEQLPSQVLNEAARHATESDLMIVIGSTLVVYPAALIPKYAVSAGAGLVIINLSETPMDSQAAVLVRERAGETMTRVVGKVRERIGL